MISVRDLRVDYDDVCAVSDLNLDIGPGEIYGLIGPNGAGKTSTLRALMGLLEPTYGEITICGIDIRDRREEAERVLGFMPDFPAIYEDLTVWEFLDLFAASYEIPKRQRSQLIDRYLHLVDLTEKRDAMTAGLSRGMRQRLVLAKTLLPDPQVLMLDEPASGMDPNGRAHLKNILRELKTRGRTVIVSSHILSEMSEFCTAVGIMEKGVLVQSGQVEEVTERVLGLGNLVVEVLEGQDGIERILAEDSRVGQIQRDGRLVEFAFAGDADAQSELLGRLIGAGIRVSSFTRKREGLEEVFMKVGAKEVS